jgi:hypothetical protein
MLRRIIRFAALMIVIAGVPLASHAADAPAAPPVAAPAPMPAPAPDDEGPEQKPFEPDCRFTDLFRAQLKNRRLDLVLIPPAKTTDTDGHGAFVVKTEDSDADVWHAESAPGSRGPDGAVTTFTIGCDARFDDRRAALRLTSVTAGLVLEIVGAGRVSRTFVTVALAQDARLGLVHFSVARQRRPGRGRPIHDFEAPDLLTLWNEHPAEVRRFLLPLLKEMLDDNPLRPRAGDVYRAFSTIPADPRATQQLRALLPALDAAGAAEREAASAALAALGPPGVLATARFDRSDLTPEQRNRLDALVLRQSTLNDPAASVNDPWFLADCLDDPDLRVRSAARAALRAATGRPINFDVNDPPAVRARAVENLMKALPDAVAAATTRP